MDTWDTIECSTLPLPRSIDRTASLPIWFVTAGASPPRAALQHLIAAYQGHRPVSIVACPETFTPAPLSAQQVLSIVGALDELRIRQGMTKFFLAGFGTATHVILAYMATRPSRIAGAVLMSMPSLPQRRLPGLRVFRHPVLLLQGEHASYLPTQAYAELLDALPAAREQVILHLVDGVDDVVLPAHLAECLRALDTICPVQETPAGSYTPVGDYRLAHDEETSDGETRPPMIDRPDRIAHWR